MELSTEFYYKKLYHRCKDLTAELYFKLIKKNVTFIILVYYFKDSIKIFRTKEIEEDSHFLNRFISENKSLEKILITEDEVRRNLPFYKKIKKKIINDFHMKFPNASFM
jgi:hypothetical protein